MTVAERILAGLKYGPCPLNELVPFENPIHAYIAASKLEELGRIRRVGFMVSKSRSTVVWELPPPALVARI